MRPLRESNSQLLDDEKDLVALRVKPESDRLTTFIRTYLGHSIKKRNHAHPSSWGPIYHFPEETIAWIVSILSIVIASSLLVAAIVSLYYERRVGPRIGIVGCFTVVFATAVALLTHAKRSEIFTVTAA